MDLIEKIQIKSEFNIRMKYIQNAIKMPSIKYLNQSIQSKFLKEYDLGDKVIFAKAKILEFIKNSENKENIVISFSGGKDSCVLKKLVHDVQNENKLPRSNLITSFEVFHPDTLNFIVKNKSKNDVIFTPIKTFEKIILEDGYPAISKQIAQKINHIRNTKNHGKYVRAILGLDGNNYDCLPLKYVHFLDTNFVDYEITHKCCTYIKSGVHKDKRPCFVGTTIEESKLRRNSWLRFGCINYEKNKPSICKPISLWTESNIWDFINLNKLETTPIYQNGWTRSGCLLCMFGMSYEDLLKKKNLLKKNRFELLYDNNKTMFTTFFEKYKFWKVLADMNVDLSNISDQKLLKKFNQRKQKVKEWYKNFDKNFTKILDDIENRNPKIWTRKERKWIFQKYKKSQNINC